MRILSVNNTLFILDYPQDKFNCVCSHTNQTVIDYSTVTDFAKLRGLSISVPLMTAT